jgi:hypothetical protein
MHEIASSQKVGFGGQIRGAGHLRQACCGVLSRSIGAEVVQFSVWHFSVPLFNSSCWGSAAAIILRFHPILIETKAKLLYNSISAS